MKSEPLSGWAVACFVIAFGIVCLFEDHFYALIAIVSAGAAWVPMIPIFLVGLGAEDFGSALGSLPRPQSIGGALLQLAIGIVLLPIFLIILLFLIVVVLILGAIALVPALLSSLVVWIAQSGGNLRFVADGLIAIPFGLFLYGAFFPVLWAVMAPLLALTLGEVAYQRARRRVYGESFRLLQPFYLVVALFCLSVGALRLFGPAIDSGVAVWQEVKHDTLAVAPTPTLPAWPKSFSVPPKGTVRTGIVLNDKNEEIRMTTTAHIFMSAGKSKRFMFRRGAFLTQDKKSLLSFSLVHTGEIVLYGGDENAVVEIGQPIPPWRTWLSAGETLRTNIWIDEGSTIWYCAGGDLTFRVGSAYWRKLYAGDGCFVGYGAIGQRDGTHVESPGSGKLEVKAGPNGGWFKYQSFYPKERWFQVPAGRVVDTGIAVRPGDHIRVTAGPEAIYFLAQRLGEVVIPGTYHREETALRRGTVRVKGGVVPSKAAVMVLTRGPEWK